MKDSFNAEELRPVLEMHAKSIRHAVSDNEFSQEHGKIFAAWSFSGIYPAISPRKILSPLNKNDHYDLTALTVVRHLPECTPYLGYNNYLPPGTIGKLFNHLSYRIDFLNKIRSARSSTEIKQAFATSLYLPNKNIGKSDVEQALRNYMETIQFPTLKENISLIVEMIRNNIFKLPDSIIDSDTLFNSIPADSLLNNIQQDNLKHRLSRKNNSEQTMEHHIFESWMDAIDLRHILFMNRDFREEKGKFIAVGSQMKRNFFAQEADQYSRHFLTFLYWTVAITSSLDDEINIKRNTARTLELKNDIMKIIYRKIQALIRDNDQFIYPELMRMIMKDFWIPFLSSLHPNEVTSLGYNKEEVSVAERSLMGDKQATRALVDGALQDATDAFNILALAVDPSSLDPLMYAGPNIRDNERFRRIIAQIDTVGSSNN
ncbi:MAG: hypothetical protein KDC18_12395 [Alphaproteobacteria bacterium]|nr:hypothetical protein [Alphaproteobacteria bacterium]MCB9929382.1 hypothetical protein [Alphaproteobacteria bacterium]